MDIKQHITSKLKEVLKSLGIEDAQVILERPKDITHGDISSNTAMMYAKREKKNPKEFAQSIIDKLNIPDEYISQAAIAGPGFINFFISDNYYRNSLAEVIKQNVNYGRLDINTGKTADLEWVSANPTGMLHTGHGRQIALGKAIANLLEWSGYKVTREYYYNNAGKQMDNLAKSVYARYVQRFIKDFPFPEEGYVGEYIADIAQSIQQEYDHFIAGLPHNIKPGFGRRRTDAAFLNPIIRIFFDSINNNNKKDIDIYDISNTNEEILEFFKNRAEEYNFHFIENTLKRLSIQHDVFFNESNLYKKGKIKETLEEFKAKRLSYEKDGAVWLKTSELMKDKKDAQDKVIVKSTGEPTYRLPDMAYHIDKIKRGYDLILDIFGSDHGDTYKEVLAGVQALGYDSSKIKVIIHQMVTFVQDGKPVKMSKRSDNVYYMDELLDDIGVDVAQFFYVMRSANTHLDFDIDLAKEQSDKNPVFYLQYAHARICGILRNAADVFPDYKNTSDVNYNLLTSPDELSLMKILSVFPDVVQGAAATFEPHKVITYLNEVAENYHRFYHNNRVINAEEKDLSFARLKLCEASKTVLKNGFDIIGISAPERM